MLTSSLKIISNMHSSKYVLLMLKINFFKMKIFRLTSFILKILFFCNINIISLNGTFKFNFFIQKMFNLKYSTFPVGIVHKWGHIINKIFRLPSALCNIIFIQKILLHEDVTKFQTPIYPKCWTSFKNGPFLFCNFGEFFDWE